MTNKVNEQDLLSPVLFAMNVLGIIPLRYQADFLEDDYKSILFVGGRQIGKSTMLAIKALWNAFVKPKEDILILAPTMKQSKIVYDRIMEMIQRNEFISKHVVRFNLEETRFDNGSSIRSLTTGKTGENIRGYSATMIFFDEAAEIPDRVFATVEPAMAVKGRQLIISGTPKGARGYFYSNFIQNTSTKRWHIYRVKSKESPLVSKEYLEEQKRIRTDAEYKQEFETEFIDEVGLFYPYDLVYACGEDYDYSLVAEEGYSYYIGADISRSGEDETAIVVIAVPNDESKQIKVVWAEGMSYPDLTVIAEEIISKAMIVNASKIFIDTIGVGAGVYDIVKNSLGGRAVEVELVGNRRETAYSNLKIFMEKRRIIMNSNDEKMRLQFSSFKVVEGMAGGMHIKKERNFHEDLVDALVLAVNGITNQERFFVFEGVEDLGKLYTSFVNNNLFREIRAPVGTVQTAYNAPNKPIVFYDDETGKTYDVYGRELDPKQTSSSEVNTGDLSGGKPEANNTAPKKTNVP